MGLTIVIALPVLAQNTVDETTLAPAPLKAPPDLFHNQMPGYDLPVVEEDPSASVRRAEAKKTGTKKSGSRLGSLLGFGNSPDDLDISGSQSLTFRSINVSGAGSSNYYNQFWNSESFETRTDLFMRGRIWKEFNINATLASGTFSTNRNRYSLSYNGHDTDVTYGYINAELGGNRYLSLNKSLKGYKLESQLFDKYTLSAFTTEATGTVKNEVFSGNGTSGPYFLRYTPIREGSEELRLDERELVFGQDYKLNYITGQLDFKQGLIIPPSSQVAVSYEQAQSGGEGGSLTGYQLALPISSKLSVNVMRAEQDSGSTGIPTAQITAAEDNYYGNNSTGPFVLVYKPILRSVTPIIYRLFGGELQNAGTDRPYVTVSPWMVGPYLDGENLYFAGLNQKPIQVLVGGIVQDEGTDYVVSYDTSTVTFLKAISPLLPVEIDYYALQANGSLLIDGQVVQAVTVYVDGQLQTEGIDFILTYDTGVIQFTRNVALNARVLVEYFYYQQPESFSGMRRVDGLTARYRVADGVDLGLHYARSGSRYDYSSGEVPAGQAMLLTGAYNTDRLSLSAEWEDVDETFSRLSSVGFLRNEQGMKYNFDYRVGDGLSVFRNYSHKQSSQPLYFGLDTDYSSSSFYSSGLYSSASKAEDEDTSTTVDQDAFGLLYTRQGWPNVRLTRNILGNDSGNSGSSTQTADTLDISHTFGRLGASLSLRQTEQEGQRINIATSELLPSQRISQSDSMSVNLNYNPSQKLSLAGSYTKLGTDTFLTEESTSDSDNTTFSLMYYPTSKLSIRLSDQRSNTSGAVGYSYLGGYYATSPYSISLLNPTQQQALAYGVVAPLVINGSSLFGKDDYVVEEGRTKQRRRSADVQYALSNKLNVGLTWSDRFYTSEGSLGYQSDNESDSLGFMASWQPAKHTSLFLNYSKDNVLYLGSSSYLVPTSSEILALGFSTRPKPALSLSGVLQMITSSSPGYTTGSYLSTDMTSLYLDAEYDLDTESSLSGRLEFSDSGASTGDYGNYQKWVYSLSYNRALTDILRLSVGTEYIDYLDRADTRGNYNTLLFFGQVGLRFD